MDSSMTFLCPWARSMHRAIHSSSQPSDMVRWVDSYREWKTHILVGMEGESFSKTNGAPAHSLSLLRRDVMICRIFYSVLRMIQLSMIDPNNTSSAAVTARKEIEALEPFRTS
jgi:hypothetical protein